MTYLIEKQIVYLFCYVSAFPQFQLPNCMTWHFMCACARVVQAMRKFETQNWVDRWPMNLISTCLLQLSEIAKCKLETQFTRKVYVCVAIPFSDGVINVQCKPVHMTTGIQHSTMHLTAYLATQAWCTLSRFWQVVMGGHGNRGGGAGWGKIRKPV